MKKYPLVVDIRRGSNRDGPGIRSVVFFKGCPLRCSFCHNPETQELWHEISFSQSECVECRACKAACHLNAIDFNLPGRIRRNRCDRCGTCVDACPGKGLTRIGRYFSPEALAEQLMRDVAFYRHSGGGVTLSGGECTLFPHYLERLLRILKEHHLHVVLETSGYFNCRTFCDRILPHVDIVLYDIKLIDPSAHQRFVGKPNARILENFRRLARERGLELHPRIPLVPSITSTEENLSGIIGFLREAGARKLSLLPYNPMGLQKYRSLGRAVPNLPERFMTPDEEKQACKILARYAV